MGQLRAFWQKAKKDGGLDKIKFGKDLGKHLDEFEDAIKEFMTSAKDTGDQADRIQVLYGLLMTIFNDYAKTIAQANADGAPLGSLAQKVLNASRRSVDMAEDLEKSLKKLTDKLKKQVYG